MIAIIFLSVLKNGLFCYFLIVSIGVVCVKVFAHELVPLGATGIGSPGLTDHNCPTGYWESYHGVLEESYVLVSAEPSPAHFLVLGMELKCTIGTNYNSSELKTTSTSHGAGPHHKNKCINYDKIEKYEDLKLYSNMKESYK